jgi:hypothetical protein
MKEEEGEEKEERNRGGTECSGRKGSNRANE